MHYLLLRIAVPRSLREPRAPSHEACLSLPRSRVPPNVNAPLT